MSEHKCGYQCDAAVKATWASGRVPTRTLMSAEEFASECMAAYARGLGVRGKR